jgi:pyruvate formate lyase activating enzyme
LWPCPGKPFAATSTILHDVQLNLAFLTPNDGGLTVSGVDPLLQPTFCEELFRGAHDLGVTTCLHTPPPEDPPEVYTSVLQHADSVIVQLSANIPSLAGEQDSLAAFTSFLEDMGVPYHIRYLLVPEVTDQPADVGSLVDFARSRGAQLQGIQVSAGPHCTSCARRLRDP